MMRSKKQIICLGILMLFFSCSVIDEKPCRADYILYQYHNNIGQEATSQIYTMTDFIFTKDSVLYRVDDGIMNGKVRKRPLSLPDGEWMILTYGNMESGSRVDYTLGETRLNEMFLRVVRQSTYSGTYSGGEEELKLGNSDRLYFGKLDVTVKAGVTDRVHTVQMANAHIWLSVTVRWENTSNAPTRGNSNLHVRLEHVPAEHSLRHEERWDSLYGIRYHLPLAIESKAPYVTKLTSGTEERDYYFDTYSLRWETGEAPVLRIYDGQKSLINRTIDLNKYFDEQGISLTHTRVQFFQLLVKISANGVITISDLEVADWEEGGGF